MKRECQVRHQVAQRSKQRHASLAKVHMHEVINSRSDCVSHKRRKENERDNRVVHAVVALELSIVSHHQPSERRSRGLQLPGEPRPVKITVSGCLDMQNGREFVSRKLLALTPYEPSFIPTTRNDQNVAAVRYILIAGEFHRGGEMAFSDGEEEPQLPDSSCCPVAMASWPFSVSCCERASVGCLSATALDGSVAAMTILAMELQLWQCGQVRKP